MEQFAQSANTQEAAEPAMQQGAAQAQAGEIGEREAAPAEQPRQAWETSPAAQDAGQQEAQPQQLRSVAAAARRAAEAALKQERERMQQVARAYGYPSFEEMAAQGGRQAMQRAGLDPEGLQPYLQQQIRQVIDHHPDVLAARNARVQAAVEQGLLELQRAYPQCGIRTVEDFAKMPRYEAFYDLVVKHGLSYTDAYALANREQLGRESVERGRQATRNAMQAKQHLCTNAQADGGAPTPAVPREVLEGYHHLMPHWSDAKIARHYTDSQKG